MQKIGKVPRIVFAQKLQNKIITKKTIKSILILYFTVTLCKKSEKFLALVLHGTWKASFWAHSGPLLAQKLENKIFPKKII